MSWSWSHVQEAYDAAQEILHTWDREKLIDATVEDEAQSYLANPDMDGDLDKYIAERYAYWTQAIDGFGHLFSQEMMAEHVWTIAEKNQTCSNGGFELYVDCNGAYTITLP